MFNCILFIVIIYELSLAVQSQRNLIPKRQSQRIGDISSTSRNFSQSARFTDDYSFHFGTGGHRFFPRVAANISSTQARKK